MYGLTVIPFAEERAFGPKVRHRADGSFPKSNTYVLRRDATAGAEIAACEIGPFGRASGCLLLLCSIITCSHISLISSNLVMLGIEAHPVLPTYLRPAVPIPLLHDGHNTVIVGSSRQIELGRECQCPSVRLAERRMCEGRIVTRRHECLGVGKPLDVTFEDFLSSQPSQ